MARGKHGQSADARRAVEEANARADVAEKALADLQRNAASAAEKAEATHAHLVARVHELEQDVAQGSSAALDEALDKIDELNDRIERLPYEVASKLKPLMSRIKAEPETWVKISEALGLKYGEFNAISGFDHGLPSRRDRRMTNRRANLSVEIHKSKDV